jgi:hypothetical protein
VPDRVVASTADTIHTFSHFLFNPFGILKSLSRSVIVTTGAPHAAHEANRIWGFLSDCRQYGRKSATLAEIGTAQEPIYFCE